MTPAMPGLVHEQVLQLGPMRLTIYGACAALGVLAGMGLTGRSSLRAEVAPDAAWDAGFFALLGCFLASRLLLILRDPMAFVHFPLLVLSLPSLTYGGMGVAGVAVLLWMRHKRRPVLPMLDAFAPGAAALAAFLELGHWIDGSEPGMPLHLSAGGEVKGLYPVALYGVAASILLALGLWACLGRDWPQGRVTALGLVIGGLLALGLSMLSFPAELMNDTALEPGQMVALGAMMAGALLWTFAPERPKG